MACPVCASNTEAVVYSVPVSSGAKMNIFDVKQCAACGFAHVNPVPESALLNSFYEGDYHKKRESFLNEFLCRLNRGFVVNILKKMKPRGKVLDVGCGRGAFLKAMQEAGYQSYGIEPSQKGYTISSEAGPITVINEPVEKCSLPAGNFDIVTLWHSLEHMSEPDDVLKKIRQLISPQGLLLIEVPNFSSWESRIFRTHWCHLDVPRHLSFYSKRSLEQLLRKHAFRTTKVSTESFFSSPLSVLKSAFCGVKNRRGTQRLSAIILLLPALVLSLLRVIPLLNVRSCLRIYAIPTKETC